jgi:glycine betaine/choline ABC-type transport system substrate-binding protein
LKAGLMAVLACFAVLLVVLCGCAKPQAPPIVVGSQNSTEQLVVGEIVAQRLERTLQRKVERRFGLGDELILYQAIVSGDVTLYPDYAASIETAILRERPDSDPEIVRERVRNELRRTAQLELLEPLGYESTPVVVVKKTDAERVNAKTLSDAANGTFRWKLGVSYNFEQRAGGSTALSAYAIPMVAETQTMEDAQLFPALEQGQVNMVASSLTDPRLTLPKYAVLEDDRRVFPPYQACLVVRQDALTDNPELRPALSALAGKLSTAEVRKLAAAVDLGRRKPGDVAAEFLAEAGLK